METIKLEVTIDRTVAIKHNFAQCGSQVYELTQENLASLTDEQRAEVARISFTDRPGHWTDRLDLQGPVDWPTILAAIDARIEEQKRKAAQTAAEIEEAIQNVLARPLEDWINHPCKEVRWPGYSTHERAASSDPRIIARKAEAKPLLDAWVTAENAAAAETARRDEERKAREEAAAIVLEEQKRVAREALVAMAKSDDELGTAANEGYPVSGEMFRALARRMEAKISAVSGFIWTRLEKTARDYSDLPLRSAPSVKNFEMRKQIVDLATAENEGIAPVIGRWTVSPIVSIDVCPHEGHKLMRTIVFAALEGPIGSYEILCSLETLDCSHDDDDSDDSDE